MSDHPTETLRQRLTDAANAVHQASIQSTPENRRDARSLGERIADAILADLTSEPLAAGWDNVVEHPHDPAEDTLVCCVTTDGIPIALWLDDGHREALGGSLSDPFPEDVDV